MKTPMVDWWSIARNAIGPIGVSTFRCSIDLIKSSVLVEPADSIAFASTKVLM